MVKINDLIVLEWMERRPINSYPFTVKRGLFKEGEKIKAHATGSVIEEDDKHIVILVYSLDEERLFFNVPREYITSIKILEEKQ